CREGPKEPPPPADAACCCYQAASNAADPRARAEPLKPGWSGLFTRLASRGGGRRASTKWAGISGPQRPAAEPGDEELMSYTDDDTVGGPADTRELPGLT